MRSQLGAPASRPAAGSGSRSSTCGLPPMPRAADPVDRAPELARRVDVAQERSAARPPTTSTFVRVASPRRRTGASPARARSSGSSTIVDQRRRDRRPLAAGEVARLAPDRAARHHARQLAEQPARRLRVEKITGTSPVATLRDAQLRDGAARRLDARPPPRSSSAGEEARRGPVVAVALLAVGRRRTAARRRTTRSVPRSRREPADVANADRAEHARPNIAPSELVTRVSNASAAASPALRPPDRPRRRRATAPPRPTDPARGRRAPSPRAPAAPRSDRARPAPPARRVSRANRSSAARPADRTCTSPPRAGP